MGNVPDTLVFPIESVVERLQGVAAIKFVGLSHDLVAAEESGPRLQPAVFVMQETRGKKPKFSGPPVQADRETTVKLVIWVQHHGGQAALARLMSEIKAAIGKRLAGWAPSDAFEDLYMTASRDELVHGAWLVGQELYATAWSFSAEAQP